MTTNRSSLRLAAAGLVALATAASAQDAPPLRASDVEVEAGVRLRVLAGGDAAAPVTLVFVPGWCTSSEIWRGTMEAFAASARVVALDPRSQGDSTVTTEGNTPERRAADLERVLAQLGLGRVVLVGWSQGVQDVAAYAAAFGGGRVAGYVLVDAAVGAGSAAAVANPAALRRQLDLFTLYQRHPDEYLRGMMEAILRSPAARARIDDYVRIGRKTPTDLGVAMLLADFVAVDRRPALAAFDRPTLVVAAADSEELDAQRAMATTIAGARFEVVADAGHALFLDQPRRFRELLAAFVAPLRAGG